MIGVFCSLSFDSDSAHSVYFPAEDPPSDLPQASSFRELPVPAMSNDCMTALEQALSASEARQIETQKQLEQLTNGFQQLQQLLLQQQSNSTPTPLLLPNNPTPCSVSPKLATRPLRPALPNEFDGDRSKGVTFIRLCQTYIILCPESFSDDQTKIIWALSYMKAGRAAKWAA
jgi:hypothetical protein